MLRSLLSFGRRQSLRTLIQASSPSFNNIELNTCSLSIASCLGGSWSLPSLIQMKSYGGRPNIIMIPLLL